MLNEEDNLLIYKEMHRTIFESERLYFTQLTELLTDDYLRMYNNSEIQKTLYGIQKVFTKSQIENWIRNSLQQKKPIFTIIDKNTKDFMGIIEIIQKENAMGEIVISLLPDKQGNGYGKEAIAATLNYAHEKLGLNEFDLFVLKSNQKAINCYSKVGFIAVGDGYTKKDIHMYHKR